MPSSVPLPGSPEAIAAGCRCDCNGNHKGRGTSYTNGHAFIVWDDCPLHGKPAWEAAAKVRDDAAAWAECTDRTLGTVPRVGEPGEETRVGG